MPCPDCHSSDMVEEIDSEAERLGLLAENCAVWRCLNCFTLSVRKRVEPRKKAAPPPKPEHRDRSWQPYTSAAHLPLIVTPSSFPLHPREIKKVTLTTQPPSPVVHPAHEETPSQRFNRISRALDQVEDEEDSIWSPAQGRHPIGFRVSDRFKERRRVGNLHKTGKPRLSRTERNRKRVTASPKDVNSAALFRVETDEFIIEEVNLEITL